MWVRLGWLIMKIFHRWTSDDATLIHTPAKAHWIAFISHLAHRLCQLSLVSVTVLIKNARRSSIVPYRPNIISHLFMTIGQVFSSDSWLTRLKVTARDCEVHWLKYTDRWSCRDMPDDVWITSFLIKTDRISCITVSFNCWFCFICNNNICHRLWRPASAGYFVVRQLSNANTPTPKRYIIDLASEIYYQPSEKPIEESLHGLQYIHWATICSH
jgi:hypothetical protein